MVKGVSVYLQSENGKKIIESYLEKYESSQYVEFKKKHQGTLDAELAGRKIKIDEAEIRIKELTDSKAKLSDEVQELTKKREIESQKPIKADVKQVDKQEIDSAEIVAYLHQDNKKLLEDNKKLEQAIDNKKHLVDGLVEIEKIGKKLNT